LSLLDESGATERPSSAYVLGALKTQDPAEKRLQKKRLQSEIAAS
jgi:hypothetical protein